MPGVSITDPATLYGTTATLRRHQHVSVLRRRLRYCVRTAPTSSGQETILHSFSSPPGDGIIPQAGVIAQPGVVPGSGDILYGTTYYGGPYSVNGNPGEGTVFKNRRRHRDHPLQFQAALTELCPQLPLTRRRSLWHHRLRRNRHLRHYFGTGCGTVSKLVGTEETVLYSFFQNQSNSGNPAGSLIRDSSGGCLSARRVLGGDLNCQQVEEFLRVAAQSSKSRRAAETAALHLHRRR